MTDRVLQLLLTVIAHWVVWIKPYLPIICGAIAWAIPIILVWNLMRATRDGIANVRKLHRIPCSRCQYATDNHHIKCSVHPFDAFSEQALTCQDFRVSSETPLAASLSSTESAY